MSRKSAQLRKLILLRLTKRRFFRKTKAKLIRKIARGGVIPEKLRRKYGIRASGKIRSHYKKLKTCKNKLIEPLNIAIPEQLCYLEDPVGTDNFFYGLKKTIHGKRPRDIYITHEQTRNIGLAASFFFDTIIKKERDYWREKYNTKVDLSGKISTYSKQVNNFLLSFGILHELGISARSVQSFSPDIVDFDYKNKYVKLKIIGSKKQPYKKGEASVKLVEYFNKCFQYNALEITKEAKSDLISSFGEILGNAEEHCGNEEGKWVALGCYNKDEHNCNFAIINYGKTIYENLSDPSSTAFEVIERVNGVINKHKPRLERMFGQFKSKEAEEPIWNVMALQDGISSKRTLSGTGSTRGQGIMDVLSFIDEVKAEGDGARVCVLSGRSAIIIDYKYPITNKEVGQNKELRRMIIFNNEQDLHYPPDDKKVLLLKDKFNGTIFTGSFKIDEKYLVARLGDEDGKMNGKRNGKRDRSQSYFAS